MGTLCYIQVGVGLDVIKDRLSMPELVSPVHECAKEEDAGEDGHAVKDEEEHLRTSQKHLTIR